MNDEEHASPSPGTSDTAHEVGEISQESPKPYDRWTPEADAELLAAYEAGASIGELARHFRRPPSAIEYRLRRLAFDMLRQHRLGLSRDLRRC